MGGGGQEAKFWKTSQRSLNWTRQKSKSLDPHPKSDKKKKIFFLKSKSSLLEKLEKKKKYLDFFKKT